MLPLDITFDSGTRFCFHHDTYRVSYDLVDLRTSTPSHQTRSLEPQPVGEPLHTERHHLDDSHEWSTPSHQIQIVEPQLLGEPLHTEQHHLDESHEWVVSGSRRICWIPPGYIRSGEATYCWAGRELVMVGQDGELRKLKFRS